MDNDTKTPRERVAGTLKTAILLSLIAIRVDRTVFTTQEEQSKELERQVNQFVDTILSGIESRGISFTIREDVPKAFLDA